MRKLTGAAFAAALLLTTAGVPAMAGTLVMSPQLNESASSMSPGGYSGTFDNMQAFIFDTGDSFNGGGFSSFSNISGANAGSWGSVVNGPHWAEANGPSTTTNLDFYIGVNDVTSGAPFSYDFFAFSGGNLVDSALITYDGSTTIFDPLQNAPAAYQKDVAQAVPEPSSAVPFGVGVLGLIGLVMWRRRSSTETI